MDKTGVSQEEAARKVGKSQSAVANKLRLLKLPEDVIEGLRSNHFTERHARALLRLDCPELQRAALEHIKKHQLNVAQTEAYIDRICQRQTQPHRATPVYRFRDVRLFLTTVKKSLAVWYALFLFPDLTAARAAEHMSEDQVKLAYLKF